MVWGESKDYGLKQSLVSAKQFAQFRYHNMLWLKQARQEKGNNKSEKSPQCVPALPNQLIRIELLRKNNHAASEKFIPEVKPHKQFFCQAFNNL